MGGFSGPAEKDVNTRPRPLFEQSKDLIERPSSNGCQAQDLEHPIPFHCNFLHYLMFIVLFPQTPAPSHLYLSYPCHWELPRCIKLRLSSIRLHLLFSLFRMHSFLLHLSSSFLLPLKTQLMSQCLQKYSTVQTPHPGPSPQRLQHLAGHLRWPFAFVTSQQLLSSRRQESFTVLPSEPGTQ